MAAPWRHGGVWRHNAAAPYRRTALRWAGSWWLQVSTEDGRPPQPMVGDWVQAKPPRSRIELKMYLSPPGLQQEAVRLPFYYEAKQWIGPVEAVEVSDKFVAVEIEHLSTREHLPGLDSNLRGWINVWARQGNGGVDYAMVWREATPRRAG